MLDTPITRREALKRSTISAVALATGACLGGTGPSETNDGRISARVSAPTSTMTPGIYPLGLASGRDGLLYIPAGYKSDTAAPLAILLHGAGQDSSELMTPMRPLADTTGLVLVAPDARGVTWDAIGFGAFSDDVVFIDRALKNVFSRVRVDSNRVRIIGFSDGGSYSLSLGLINGDLFSRIVAFSPGFVVTGQLTGKPKFFITHGTRDTVLPIDQTSRQIVPELKAAGYDVEYYEFDGGHGVTNDLLAQATTWASTA